MSPYTFEFEDGTVREWTLTGDGAEPRLVEDYTPSLFVSGPDDALVDLRARLEDDPKVDATDRERWATDLHQAHVGDRSRVLRVDLERVDEVRTLAREIRGVHERETHAPGTFRLFDVDLEPGVRYCLDEGIDPTPGRELRPLRIELSEPALADGDVAALRLDGEPIDERTGDPAAVLRTLGRRLVRRDPDVLVVSHGELIPLIERRAAALGLEGVRLGRLPGWTQLAGENTYVSYGRAGHSPARYRVPGRAIVDTSNSFLWNQSGLDGLQYMVERTGRPLQEAAWGSIGTLLTSRQIRIARDRSVLAPWNKWEPESFTDVRTLHAADRGGFTFAPEVGFHETVHAIDFASLYPRIICEYNVSPETIDCGCGRPAARDGCGGDGTVETVGERNGRVPGLGYERCSHDGFLPDVLEPLLADREKRKRRLAADPSEPEAARLRAESGAIKWVLVSCFGYQGYRNAKFGRIECHEAINAYAREIALAAKRRLEDAGWRIVHGIVDSLWVTPRVPDPEPLDDVTAEIGETVGIPLEDDGSYEWVCFVPLRESIAPASEAGRAPAPPVDSSPDSDQTGTTIDPATEAGGVESGPAGALTKYFGKREDGGFTVRGIELRQRSTPPFVAESQRAFLEALDRERDPRAVCDVLGRRLRELRSGAVDPANLEITKRISRSLEAYSQRTHTVAALERYDRRGIDRRPGQSVRYVVVDDEARGSERVRLPFEGIRTYDEDWYATSVIRACESVVSPLGWDRRRIRTFLRDGRTPRLSTFVE
ncbi:DNA polymerase domain-containing protein [Natrarchaeobius oligotrophus]|uniref:DNA-directed DNA polymerase n=1 Tax=Natrarchaeobius chitinivorans TaxID=1679083 RepID=A0A3N6MLP9_NATCH|nr:DNA polymerase domain-containing protein [Natrarchaeobius chitinivorans]RQG95306.1 DNA polymerase I [Natrarchaeobius chitinivorans]